MVGPGADVPLSEICGEREGKTSFSRKPLWAGAVMQGTEGVSLVDRGGDWGVEAATAATPPAERGDESGRRGGYCTVAGADGGRRPASETGCVGGHWPERPPLLWVSKPRRGALVAGVRWRAHHLARRRTSASGLAVPPRELDRVRLTTGSGLPSLPPAFLRLEPEPLPLSFPGRGAETKIGEAGRDKKESTRQHGRESRPGCARERERTRRRSVGARSSS